MKKTWSAALLALILLWSLTACGAAGAPAGSAGQPSAAVSADASTGATAPADAPEEGETAAAQPGRAERGTIDMTVEGQTEQVAATLYIAEGYSLYIPDEGWEKDTEKAQWKSANNDLVLFGVLDYPGSTPEEGRKEILRQWGDYYGFRDMAADNTFFGYNGKEGGTMNVRMVGYDGGVFALWNSYPDAAEEGFWPRMTAILDTFEATGRPASGTIDMTVEGQTERVAATLYSGDGYSLYIPNEGWRCDTDPEDREVSWESTRNDDAQLTVRVWPGMGSGAADALFDAFQKTEDDFSFAVKDGVLVGRENRDGGTMMVVYPHLSGADAYTVAIEYPDAAAEGFDSRLAAMAATFRTES